MRINKDDTVVVLTGSEAGERGRVISVNREKQTVTVEGINMVHKHVKRSRRNMQGGRLTKEMPMPQGKVQILCTACNKPTRLGAKIKPDGSKFRVCKKCNAQMGQISPAKTKQ